MSDEKKSEEGNVRPNTGSGANIYAPVTNTGGINQFGGSIGSVNHSQNTTTHNTTSGDTISISGNNIQGSNFNFKSTLNNVTQSIGTLPNTDDATKDELKKLIADLQSALAQVPPEHTEDAQKVTERVEALVKEVKAPKPDEEEIKSRGDSLKRAAEKLAGIAGPVATIASAIVTKLLGH